MSSATITPPEIFCCGPLGSLRYYMLQIVGVTGTCPQCNLNCDCDGINGTYFTDFLGPYSLNQCATELVLTEICGYVLLTFQIVPCSTRRVTYKIVLGGTAGTTPATNFIWELSNIESAMETRIVPFKSQLGGECSASSSYVIVTPVAPIKMASIQDECFPRRNCPDSRTNFPPIFAPKESVLDTTCCACGTGGGGAFDLIPGKKGGSGSCAGDVCAVSYNVENGNVMMQLSVPTGGPWAPAPVLTLNSTYASSNTIFGKRISSVFTQRVFVSGEQTNAISASVCKCDGSIEVHTCKPAGAGVYIPPPDSLNILTLNGDNSWTEKTGDGSTYDYASTGYLSRITNPNGAIWTVVGGATPVYVVDPASRRSTFAYDSTTGRFRRFQDVYGRITSITLDSGNRLTQFVTPELCTTELRYNSDDRLTAAISPSGLRTSVAYTADGLCSQITLPDGGTYAYAYSDWLNTSITAPDGSVTAVRHFVSRQVQYVQGPTGIRNSFTYSGRRLLSAFQPSGERTTMAYAALGSGAMGLAATIKSDGRASILYDANSRVSATVNVLGNRTTFLRNANGLVTTQIDALNQRNSFVYNASGQGTVTINPLGARETLIYASTGEVKAQINPLAQRTTLAYAFGQRTSVKNAIGAIATSVYDRNNRLLSQIDPLGNRNSFIYNSCSAPVATIRPDGARTTNIYAFGRVKATIDPLGRRNSFAYDISGRRIRSQSPLGRINTIIYNSRSQPVATINPSGLRSTTVFDSANRAAATIDPAGLRTTTIFDTCCSRPKATIAPTGVRNSFAYNKLGSQIRTVSPTGAINTTVYDVLNRTIANIDPLGKRTSTIYNAANQPIASVNALNQRSTTVYNVANQAVASINALGFRTTQVYDAASRGVASINPKGNRWTTVYDLASRSVASIDPLSRRTTSVYNKNSAVIATINPAGSRNSTVYNIAGQTVANVDAKGARTTTTYNADSQQLASINALGFRTTNIYDTGGRGVATMDARGNRNTTVYDTKGRFAASINPLGNRWSTIFNTVGQTVASKDPLGNRNTTVYDTAARVVAGINPLGFRSTTVFNIASQVLATIDANGNRVSNVYDPVGRRYVEINANGARTTTIFNAVGQTAALVDARGNRHSLTYDSTGAQTQLIDPLNRRTTSAYDAAGQQTLRIDARSNRTSFVYSTVGQLTGRKYPDGSRATFSYDTVGNRTLMADSTRRYTNVYDAVGQTTVTASPNSQRQTFSYDTIGQRRSMDATGAGRFTYQYDAANQISSLRNPYSERTTFGYDDAGRRNVQRNANGTRVSLSYDAASQTTQVFHRTSAGASVLQLDYQYDNAGNRKSMAENATAARTTWTYDKQNQLLGEYRTGTNPYRQTFTYDTVGNRTLKNVDTVRTTYVYDVANQLKYGQAVAGRTSFAYDATGNQRIEQPPTGNRTTTTWNYENQPTQYRLPTGSPVTMSYNGDNRRVISQQGATSTKFVWDATTDAYLSELDGANAVQAVYTNEPQQYGSILSQRRSSTSHCLHADALGTTRLLTGSTQTTSDTYLLDAWGNPITSSGSTVNPFRWVGRYGYYQDASTGMIYVRARMYLPTVARWMSVDVAYGTIFLSQYPYSMNDPGSLSDPSGNCPCCCCVDDIDYTPLKLESYWPAGQERPAGDAARFGRWPVSFQVVATNALVPGPGSPVCEMEWNECSDVGGNRGQIAGQWKKFSPSDGIGSGISGPDPSQCPGWFQQFIGDAPTLDEIDGAVKRVNFFVRARSSVGCSCSSSEVSVAFNLVVETVKVDVLNPGKPPKFKPSPPVLKPGLDRTITGCDTLPGAV